MSSAALAVGRDSTVMGFCQISWACLSDRMIVAGMSPPLGVFPLAGIASPCEKVGASSITHNLGQPRSDRSSATELDQFRSVNNICQGGNQAGIIIQGAHTFEPNSSRFCGDPGLVIDIVEDLKMVGNEANRNY
jgi:hypothetical protein